MCQEPSNSCLCIISDVLLVKFCPPWCSAHLCSVPIGLLAEPHPHFDLSVRINFKRWSYFDTTITPSAKSSNSGKAPQSSLAKSSLMSQPWLHITFCGLLPGLACHPPTPLWNSQTCYLEPLNLKRKEGSHGSFKEILKRGKYILHVQSLTQDASGYPWIRLPIFYPSHLTYIRHDLDTHLFRKVQIIS